MPHSSYKSTVECHRPFWACTRSFALLAALAAQPALAGPLQWNERDGVIWTTPTATVHVDRAQGQAGPLLRFGGDAQAISLGKPTVTPDGDDKLNLVYATATPDGNKLDIRRHIEARVSDNSFDFVETFEFRPASPIRQDLEVARPFAIENPDASQTGGDAGCVFPLKNGWVRPSALATAPLAAEYRLGHWIGGKDTPELALPVVQIDHNGHWQAAVCADPRFSAQFSVSQTSAGVAGEVRYRYLASRVPITGVETRSFGFALRKAPPPSEPFGRTLDAFFRLMLPDVPPGPRWLHEIYMIKYDYLSDDGQGWLRDADKLAEWLTPDERKHVAMCFHGWYDYLGVYTYDQATGRMKDEWVAMPGSRKVAYTRQKMQDQLRHARELGFRVLLYFGDGMLQDSGAPGYHAEWNLLNDKGEPPRPTWEGPDTVGKTQVRDPSNPDVAQWYQGYLRALLKDYGPVLDGFVWDETSYVREGDIMVKPAPGYCARGMFDLVKSLTAQVEAYDAQKVFLTSDCIGFPAMGGYPSMNDAVGYGMVADGNFQDTWCIPEAWSWMLLPNWRNTSWSCIWAAVTNYHWMKWGVENYGTPVSITNGFGDDLGPAEWKPELRDEVLALFRKRMAAGPAHVRLMTEDPAKLVAERGPDAAVSDSIPTTQPGEVNWALASSGSRATASSELIGGNSRYPASGAIDGSRGHEGWNTGHGWASDGTAMPHWLQVEFKQPRPISRFVITTYDSPGESAGKHGVAEYTVEIWDDAAQQWKAVAHEDRERILVTRVHTLPQPVTTSKFRVVVKRVAVGAGGIARLLQVEAWGAEPVAK